MKKQNWKYAWRWNEEYVICGGQGAEGAKNIIKCLKIKGFDCRINVESSGYIGSTFIEILCKDIKTKKEIQRELYQVSYTDKMYDEYAWEKIKVV